MLFSSRNGLIGLCQLIFASHVERVFIDVLFYDYCYHFLLFFLVTYSYKGWKKYFGCIFLYFWLLFLSPPLMCIRVSLVLVTDLG